MVKWLTDCQLYILMLNLIIKENTTANMIKMTKGIRIYSVSFVKQRMILDAALGYNHQN